MIAIKCRSLSLNYRRGCCLSHPARPGKLVSWWEEEQLPWSCETIVCGRGRPKTLFFLDKPANCVTGYSWIWVFFTWFLVVDACCLTWLLWNHPGTMFSTGCIHVRSIHQGSTMHVPLIVGRSGLFLSPGQKFFMEEPIDLTHLLVVGLNHCREISLLGKVIPCL